MSGYFVTATGTGVGKTFATCALVHGAKGNAWGYKPIISGFEQGGTDTHQLIEAMGEGGIDEISPWRFTAPLSPDMAASREGKTLQLEAVAEWCHARASLPGLRLIEGVGGVMVPLNAQHTIRDLMLALNLPVILVAGTYLGTISHTLTAIEALRGAGLSITAVILSESEQSPVPLPELQAAIHSHAKGTLIVPQPRVSSWAEASAIHRLAGEL